MELGNVKPVNIVKEMADAYLDYSMSVIVSRALPDVRDGLKPVHRRVLYAMDQMGLQSTKAFRKCAGTVGEVLKSYHPHGDVAVYDSLVRMAQPWSMRYPLVLGQGNFGSQDDDPPAAMRYCVTGERSLLPTTGWYRSTRSRNQASKTFLCESCRKTGKPIRPVSGGIAARSRPGACGRSEDMKSQVRQIIPCWWRCLTLLMGVSRLPGRRLLS